MDALSIIQPDGWKKPKGFSNGMLGQGRVLFVAGQIGWDGQLSDCFKVVTVEPEEYLGSSCQPSSASTDGGYRVGFEPNLQFAANPVRAGVSTRYGTHMHGSSARIAFGKFQLGEFLSAGGAPI